MRKYENFCNALSNMKDIYNYEEPYDNVVITGLVGLYEICFEQSWKMMKEILEIHGYAEGATGSPKIILKTAYKAGMIRSVLSDVLRTKNRDRRKLAVIISEGIESERKYPLWDRYTILKN